MKTSSQVGFDGAQAMSTYLHETIHWWQHIGSTYGLIFGLNYPVKSHSTHKELRTLADRGVFVKSIRQFAEGQASGVTGGYGTDAGLANFIVNQHNDLEAYRRITFGGPAAKQAVHNPLFESVGHAFHMTYSNTVSVIAATVDPTYRIFPNPSDWQDGFRRLKSEKHENFIYGETTTLWPFGSREIFEGQARFSQIQYIYNASGKKFSWEDFRDIGWFLPVYISAFEHFLKLIEEAWPSDVGSPLVGLFLLVCDFSLNSGSGFPFTIDPNYSSFLYDVTPAARFVFACRMIKSQFPSMKTAIIGHSREEYENIGGDIAQALKEPAPLIIAQSISSSFVDGGPLNDLKREYDAYDFSAANYSVRFLLAHFMAFQRDKAQYPEVFCWPGSWMAGENIDERAFQLFDRHGAPFVDRENDDGIFPRLQSGRSETQIQEVLDNFYSHVVSHSMTDQWIAEPGPFTYDLSWLIQRADTREVKEYMSGLFVSLYGHHPDDIRCL